MIIRVKQIFNFLDKNDIRYLLLRPLDFSKELTDIDLIMDKGEFLRLLELLKESKLSVKCQYTNYRESIKLYVDGITLDIQHYVSFLPYKGLVIRKDYPISGIDIQNDSIIVPLVSDEVLFTFWLYRLLLCKGKLSNESIPVFFKDKFSDNWEHHLNCSFFKEWTGYICGAKKHDYIVKLLTSFFKGRMQINSVDYNSIFIDFVFKNHLGLNIVYFIIKIKFKIFRRLGLYHKVIEVNSILKSY